MRTSVSSWSLFLEKRNNDKKAVKQSSMKARVHYLHLLADLRCEYAGMATTCLAAVVKKTRVLIAHVGDSRAYLIHYPVGSLPTITRLTTDHSLAAEMARERMRREAKITSALSSSLLMNESNEGKRCVMEKSTSIDEKAERLLRRPWLNRSIFGLGLASFFSEMKYHRLFQ